jgi:hypothetical protein
VPARAAATAACDGTVGSVASTEVGRPRSRIASSDPSSLTIDSTSLPLDSLIPW